MPTAGIFAPVFNVKYFWSVMVGFASCHTARAVWTLRHVTLRHEGLAGGAASEARADHVERAFVRGVRGAVRILADQSIHYSEKYSDDHWEYR